MKNVEALLGANREIQQVTIEQSLELTHEDRLSLRLLPSDVESFRRDGADLYVSLTDGDAILLTEFFSALVPRRLYLSGEEDETLVDVVFSSPSDGLLTDIAFIPEAVNETSSGLVFGRSEGVVAVAASSIACSAAGLPWQDVAVVGAGLGLAAAGASTDTNESRSTTNALDHQPGEVISNQTLEAPSVIALAAESISGKAEPGAKVLIDVNGDGVADVEVVAQAETGAFSAIFSEPLIEGAEVSLIATHAEASASSSTVAIVHATPPDQPIVDEANGLEIRGAAEPGSIVELLIDGAVLVTTADSQTGEFRFLASAGISFEDEQAFSVTATDAVGNTSEVTAGEVDAAAPPAPIIVSGSASLVVGIAEPEALIQINIGGVCRSGFADPDTGEFRFEPIAPNAFEDGELISVIAIDAAGNASSPGVGIVDASAPDAPTLTSFNGDAVTGLTEPGATVEVVVGGVLLSTIADPETGVFGVSLRAPNLFQEGEPVIAVAVDAAGNGSPAATASIDTTAPCAPTLISFNGAGITGLAEPGATVEITVGGALLSTIADPQTGEFSVTPLMGDSFDERETVSAVAVDPAGNLSPAAMAFVDVGIPDPPTLSWFHAAVVTGLAETAAPVAGSVGDLWMITVTESTSPSTDCKTLGRDCVSYTDRANQNVISAGGCWGTTATNASVTRVRLR